MRQDSTLALLGRPSENQEKAGRKNSHLDAISPREEIKLGRGEVAQPFYTGIRCNKSSTLTLMANNETDDEARITHTDIARS